MSLVLRHRAAVMAAALALASGAPQEGVAAPMPETGDGASDYRALLAALEVDQRQLSEIQSVDARNPVKATMAVKYDDWVNGALDAGLAGQAAQDEIVTTMMIWAIDTRNFDRALQIAGHVLTHGLTLPERFKRTAACLVAENVAEHALGDPACITLPQLLRTAELTEGRDMPDQARAKLMKALGRASATAAHVFDPSADNAPAGGKPALFTAAVGWFERALRLDKNSGVKKDLETAQRELAKLVPADTQQV